MDDIFWKSLILDRVEITSDGKARIYGADIVIEGVEADDVRDLAPGTSLLCHVTQGYGGGTLFQAAGRVSVNTIQQDTDLSWIDAPRPAPAVDEGTRQVISSSMGNAGDDREAATKAASRVRPEYVTVAGIGDIALYPTEYEATVIELNEPSPGA